MQTLLLTGTGGFVGKNLKEYLERDNKFKLLTPRSFELDLCDRIAVKDYFNSNRIDFIVHCSSKGGMRGIADAEDVERDNIEMLNNLINFKNTDVRIITFGSGAMYDKSRNLHKVSEFEIGKFIPKDFYGKSKLDFAEIVKRRDDITCLNIFGSYGKYERETRFPTYAITQNLNSKPIIINQNVIFDYIYIEDLCKIIHYFILKRPGNKIINVTPTKSITLTEISDIINCIADKKSEIIVKNPTMNNEYTGDNSILLKEIPELKFTSYKTGLATLNKHIKRLKFGAENEKD